MNDSPAVTLPTRCSWCGRGAPDGPEVSHVICGRCLRRHYPSPTRAFLREVVSAFYVIAGFAALGLAAYWWMS